MYINQSKNSEMALVKQINQDQPDTPVLVFGIHKFYTSIW